MTSQTASTRPWSHEIPEGHWDAVIIGTGMGGMVAGATLAKVGKRVLLLEQHNIPGGFTQTFKRPGYRWDVGVHIVGEMSDRGFPSEAGPLEGLGEATGDVVLLEHEDPLPELGQHGGR